MPSPGWRSGWIAEIPAWPAGQVWPALQVGLSAHPTRATRGRALHVNIELADFPDGWRLGGTRDEATHQSGWHPAPLIHTTIDDRTLIAYVESHHNERAVTAAEFWRRALRHHRRQTLRKVHTDSGTCHRSR